MSIESAITIERLRNVYCVAAGHPAPDELRSRLDALVRSEVMEACRRALAPRVDDNDPSIWLISSIDVDLAIDVGSEAAWRGAAAWGELIAIEIGRALERGPGPAVLRFADRVAYIAQWARDMAVGQAWSKWYYREFDSLRCLPQSAAIAEGIIREGDEALAILLRLNSLQALQPVLDVLSNGDAHRLYKTALPASPGRWNEIARWASRVLALWSGLAQRTHDSPACEALRMAAAVLTEWPVQRPGDTAGLYEAVNGLLELHRLLGACTPELAQQMLEAAMAQPHEKTRLIPDATAMGFDLALQEFVRGISGGDPQWAGFAAAVMAAHPIASGAAEETILSELAGVFLLASAFSDLGMHPAMLAAARSCEDAFQAAAVLRHLLAVRCLGRSRAALAIQERTVQEFSGIPPRVTLGEMAGTLAAADVDTALRVLAEAVSGLSHCNLPDNMAQEHSDYFDLGATFPELRLDADRERSWRYLAACVLRNFAGRLPGFARSSPEYIFQNFLGGTSQLRFGNSRIEVRLAQSPLSVVLRMAGMYRNLTLPWREGVEICLQAPPG